MSSSIKTVLENNVRSMVNSVMAAYCEQLSSWLHDNKDVEVSSEELCAAFELTFKSPQTPAGAQVSTITPTMPSLPNYYSGTAVATPKKRGGRTKKVVNEDLPKCAYILTRGREPGKQCGNQVVGDNVTLGGDRYCKICLKKASVKATLDGSSSKSTVQPAVLPGSTVEIPSNVENQKNELQVVAIPGQEGKYRETNHGFIVEVGEDGGITAVAIDDDNHHRELRPHERQIALSLGINVVAEPTVLPMPQSSSVPAVPSIPQIPQLHTLPLTKS